MKSVKTKITLWVFILIGIAAQSAWLFHYSDAFKENVTIVSPIKSDTMKVIMPFFSSVYADFNAIKLSLSIGELVGTSGIADVERYKEMIDSSKQLFFLNSHVVDYSYMFSGMLHGKAIGDNQDERAISADIIMTYGIRSAVKEHYIGEYSIVPMISYDDTPIKTWVHPLAWELFFLRGMNTFLNDDVISRKSFDDMVIAYKLSGSPRMARMASVVDEKNNGRIFASMMLYRKMFMEETDPVIKKGYNNRYEYYSFILDVASAIKPYGFIHSGYPDNLKFAVIIKKEAVSLNYKMDKYTSAAEDIKRSIIDDIKSQLDTIK